MINAIEEPLSYGISSPTNALNTIDCLNHNFHEDETRPSHCVGKPPLKYN